MIESQSHDSSKDNHTKSMNYQTQQEINEEAPNSNAFVVLIPRPIKESKIFFGGHQFYICFRFYYTLFERFLKAFELASEIPQNEDTLRMSSEEKYLLATERYETFKEILKLYLKENFDASIYEDCLRCIYGRDAGFLFSIDKIIGNIIKNIPSDELSAYVFESRKELFKDNQQTGDEETDSIAECIKYAAISQKMK